MLTIRTCKDSAHALVPRVSASGSSALKLGLRSDNRLVMRPLKGLGVISMQRR